MGVVVLATLACYFNIPGAEFVYDDGTFVVKNLTLRTMTPFDKFFLDPKAYSADGRFAIYRAIPAISFATDYQISYMVDRWKGRENFEGKPDPMVFHVTNIVLHAADACLVLILGLVLFRNIWAATLGALVFAVHPLNVEAVSWVTRRGNQFFLLFALIGFILHVRMRQGARHTTWLWVGTVGCYALSVLSQELGVALPGLLLAYDLLLAPKSKLETGKSGKAAPPDTEAWHRLAKLVTYYMPFVVTTVFYVLLRKLVLGQLAQQDYYEDSFFITMLTMVKVFVNYLGQLFVPTDLAVNYAVPLETSLLSWGVLWRLGVLVGLAGSAVALWRKVPLYAFCVAWFFITLGPASNIVPLQSLQNDRFLYMTTVGLGLGLAGLLAWASRSMTFRQSKALAAGLWTVLGAGVCTWGVMAFLQNRVWMDGFSLWHATVAAQPNSVIARVNLGKCYQDRGETEKAFEQWEAAAKLEKKPYVALLNMAEVYAMLWEESLKRGDSVRAAQMEEKATEMLERVVAVDPERYPGLYKMGLLNCRRGRWAEAEQWFKKALATKVRQPEEKFSANMLMARLLIDHPKNPEDIRKALVHAQEAYHLMQNEETGLTLVQVLLKNGKQDVAKDLSWKWYRILPAGSPYKDSFAQALRAMKEIPTP